MVRVNMAYGKAVCLELNTWEGLTASRANFYVVKHLLKGKKLTIVFTITYFMATIPQNWSIPISQICRVKNIKARISGACAAVQVNLFKFPSIVSMNGLQTCGRPDWTADALITKAKADCLKIIASPTQIVIHPMINRKINSSLSYVMLNPLNGFGTRSPVLVHNAYKYYELKGVGYFARKFSTADLARSSEAILQELKRLQECSEKNNIDQVNATVKSLLSNPNFWIYCYESIWNNSGVPCLDENSLTEKMSTLDSISLEFFHKLSILLPKGRFRFKSSCKIYTSKKQAGNRLLEIEDLRDKIVQKGIAILLEILCEHRFYECSFGSRKGKSVHDALAYIKKKVPSGMWAIEGDVLKCFDSFNPKRLVSLLKKKYVSEQVFVDLLYKALKIKIISINSSFVSKIGSSQGSVISPILLNIYLHEFDCYINENDNIHKFRKDMPTHLNPKFVSSLKFSKAELIEAERVKKIKGKRKYWKFLQKLRISKLRLAKKNGIPRFIYKGIHRRISYVRYSSSFIVFVWGTKNDCLEIKKLVSNFFKSHLDLNLSDEKTYIRYLKKDKAKFLGFEIWQSLSDTPSLKKEVNPLGKVDRIKFKSKYRAAAFQPPQLRITFNMKVVFSSLVDKGLLRYKGGKFYPTSFRAALQYDIANIVNYIRSVFFGLANFYGFAYNWYDAKIIYNYFGRYCTAMTIAHKTKSKVTKIFKKYGFSLCVTNEHNKKIAEFELLTNAKFKRNVNSNVLSSLYVTNIEQLLLANLRIAKKAMR